MSLDSIFDIAASRAADNILAVYGVEVTFDPGGVDETPVIVAFDQSIISQIQGNELSIYQDGFQILTKSDNFPREPITGDKIEHDGDNYYIELSENFQKPWISVWMKKA